MQKALFTTADIDEGKLVIQVQDILGKPGEVLMHFPNWRERQKAVAEFASGKGQPGALIALTVKHQDKELNRLSAESLSRIDEMALAMVFGDAFLKKTKATMANLQAAMQTPTEAGSDSKPI